MGWIANNLEAVIGVFELLGFAVMGILVLTGTWWSQDSSRRGESDRIADGLIDRLQKTVDKNVTDMAAMSARIDDQQKEIHQLQGKNEAYLQIITLRDPSVAKVFEEAPQIYLIARETHSMVKNQSEALESLTKSMEDFLNRLPPLMPSMKS